MDIQWQEGDWGEFYISYQTENRDLRTHSQCPLLPARPCFLQFLEPLQIVAPFWGSSVGNPDSPWILDIQIIKNFSCFWARRVSRSIWWCKISCSISCPWRQNPQCSRSWTSTPVCLCTDLGSFFQHPILFLHPVYIHAPLPETWQNISLSNTGPETLPQHQLNNQLP